MTDSEAKAIALLVKNTSYAGHVNWSRNSQSSITEIAPTPVFAEVMQVITEECRHAAYSFISLDGNGCDTSLVKLKETDSYLGLINNQLIENQQVRQEIISYQQAFNHGVIFNSFLQGGEDSMPLAILELEKIKDSHIKESLLNADKANRDRILSNILIRLREFAYFVEF